jgi:phenylalanyl-tRNA synthetase beta chain
LERVIINSLALRSTNLTLFLTGNRAKESWTTAQNRLTSSYLKAMLMLYSLDLEFKTQNSPVTSDVFSEGIAIGAGHNALVEFGVVKNQYLNILE